MAAEEQLNGRSRTHRVVIWLISDRSSWFQIVVWSIMPWLPLVFGLDPSWTPGDLWVGVTVAFLLSYSLGALAIFVGSTVNRRAFLAKYTERSDLRVFALGLVCSILTLIGVYSYLYWRLSVHDARVFSEQLSKASAIYFTVTTFTTTGFGDIHPVSDGARLLVTTQMLLGAFVLVVIVASVVARVYTDSEE